MYGENVNGSVAVNDPFRIRFELENSGADSRNASVTVQYRLNGGSWTLVGAVGAAVERDVSPWVSNNDPTADRLTSSAFLFVAGVIKEYPSGGTDVSLNASEHTELEFVLEIESAEVDHGDTIDLRLVLVAGETPLEAYTVTPSITVDKMVAERLGWFHPLAEPVLLPVPPRINGEQFFGAEPSLWPVEEVITVDKWYRPLSEPVLPPPPRPHGERVFHPPPALWPPEEVITVDKWFWPLSQPVLPPPPRLEGFGVLPAEQIVNPDPFLDEWWTELQRPVWPAAALDVMPSLVADPSIPLSRFYAEARGKYRVFNAAEYRFYWGAAIPAEGDSPQETSATLPYTSVDTFIGTGTWYVSASWFNGVLDSGFLPLGPGGETYLRLDLAADVEINNPPAGPNEWRLEAKGAGVVRVWGLYYELGSNRADTWAIAYTLDGSDPPADTPDATQTMPAGGLAVLQYDLPVTAGATTVKVRLQTYRASDTRYSENSTIKTLTSDAAGPTVPLDADRWPGGLPEEV